MSEPAELRNDLAQGPEGGAAWWLTASDSVRIRVGGWGAGAEKGTILLFPGRSEYIEKYGRTAQDFLDQGYATLAIDWRGQGLADRQLDDPQKGQVEDFADFQKDVAELVAHTEEFGFKPPYFLVAHSMGGGIGYRALHEGLPVQAAAFSGPMWGLVYPTGLKHIVRPIAAIVNWLGFGNHYIFGGVPDNYVQNNPFEGNELTRDAEMFRYMQDHVNAEPGFGLGGPTFRWLRGAISEMRFIQNSKPRDIPVICFLGSEEKIVLPDAIRKRMRNWPGGKLVELADAEHEAFMEIPETRHRVTREICDFFDQHRG